MQANQRARLLGATVEVVGERGYDGTTVRDIARVAGVSKASLYEQFSGKDECLIATCDTALRLAAGAVLRGESSAGEGRDGLRAGLASLADLIAARPKGARLVLIDGPAATSAIRDYVRQRFGLLEALVRERLAASPGGRELPRPLVVAIVRGIAHHVRRCVRAERPDRLRELVDPLLDWGLGFNSETALAAFAAPARPIRAPVPEDDSAEDTDARNFLATRDLLMEATLQLASSQGYAALTPARIRRAAGVSRRSFDANFPDATSCFLAAVETELDAIVAGAMRVSRAEGDWGRRTCLIVDRLAVSLASVPDLARLAFVESLDAAPASLLWRERLIGAWADDFYRGAPSDSRPSPAVAEATVAAIWGFLADAIEAGCLNLLPTQGTRLAFFALAPALGAGGATETIEATWDVASRVP